MHLQPPCIQSTHFLYKNHEIIILLDDKYKCTTNVRDKDHKITKIHHFVAWYKHSNVTSNVRMLQHLEVHSNVEHSFMHYCIYKNCNISIIVACTDLV